MKTEHQPINTISRGDAKEADNSGLEVGVSLQKPMGVTAIEFLSTKPSAPEQRAARIFSDSAVLDFLSDKYGAPISSIKVGAKKKGEPEFQKTSDASHLKLLVSPDSNAAERWVKKIQLEAASHLEKRSPWHGSRVFGTLLMEIESWGLRGFSAPTPPFIEEFVERFKSPSVVKVEANGGLDRVDLLSSAAIDGKLRVSQLRILQGCFSESSIREELSFAYRRAEKQASQAITRVLGTADKFQVEEILKAGEEFKKLAILSICQSLANPNDVPQKLIQSFENLHQVIEYRAAEPTTSAMERHDFTFLENFHSAVSELVSEFDRNNIFALIDELTVVRGLGNGVALNYRLDWEIKASHAKGLIETHQSMVRLANEKLGDSIKLVERTIEDCIVAVGASLVAEDALRDYKGSLLTFAETLASLSVSPHEKCKAWFNRTFELCLGPSLCPQGTDAGFVYGCLIDLQSWFGLEKTFAQSPYLLANRDIFQAVLRSALKGLFEDHLNQLSLSRDNRYFSSDPFHLGRMSELRDTASKLENATTLYQSFCFLHDIAEQDIAIKRQAGRDFNEKSRSKMIAMTDSVLGNMSKLFETSPEDYREMLNQYSSRLLIEVKSLIFRGTEIGLALSLAERLQLALEEFGGDGNTKNEYSELIADGQKELESLLDSMSATTVDYYILGAISHQLESWSPVPSTENDILRSALKIKLAQLQ